MNLDDDFDLEKIISDIEENEDLDDVPELDVDRDFSFENLKDKDDYWNE